MRDFIKNFPPPLVKGTAIGFDDSVTPDEVEHLRSLGYDALHYLQATGPRLLEVYLEGSIKGLIEFDKAKFAALESMRKYFNNTSKEEVEAGLEESAPVDAIGALAMIGTQRTDVGVEPTFTKKRGRPPGKR